MSAPFSEASVHRLVPFVHVHDVEASLRFYGLLGFASRHVLAVSHPDYMPGGELRVADPDGYCILVGRHS